MKAATSEIVAIHPVSIRTVQNDMRGIAAEKANSSEGFRDVAQRLESIRWGQGISTAGLSFKG